MRKTILVLALVLTAALLTSCASSGEGKSEPAVTPMVIDLDLANLSGTVVYSQVYNIMYEPESYLGKVIRIAGYYSPYEDTTRGVVYHACVIPDATACCAQGMEFIWKGEHSWPDDYPVEMTDITVTGRLEMYEEDGNKYLHLVDADVIWEQGDEETAA